MPFLPFADPADLRNSLSSSSAFARRTISNALSDSGSRGKKEQQPRRSVEISYNEDDDSSSFFHAAAAARGRRRVERVVELDTEESFDRTNPFSNARDWKGSRKGSSSGKFSSSGSARKFRR